MCVGCCPPFLWVSEHLLHHHCHRRAFGPAACGRDSHLMAAASRHRLCFWSSGAACSPCGSSQGRRPSPGPGTAHGPVPALGAGGRLPQAGPGRLGETCLDPKLPCGHRCHAVRYLGFGFRASCERWIKQSKRKLRRGGPGFPFLTRGGCCIRRGHRRSPSEAGRSRGPSLGVTAAPGYLRAEAPDAPPNRPPG